MMNDVTREITCRSVVGSMTDWSEGALSEESMSAFEKHLEACASCRRFASQFRLTTELTRSSKSGNFLDRQKEDEILQLFSTVGAAGEVRDDAPAHVANGGERGVVVAPSGASECLELDESMARAYLDDQLPDQEQIAVLEHLIEGCQPCRRACVEIASPELIGKLKPRVSMREAPLSDTLELQYEKQLQRLHELFEEEREPVLDEDVDRQKFFLWLIRRGRDLTEREPVRSVSVASIAALLGNHLGPEHRIRAAMLEGLVLRKVRGDFAASDRCFSRARRLARQSDEKVLEGKVLSLWAFSLFSQSRLGEAIALYEEAMELFSGIGDFARWAECLMDMTRPLEELDPSASISLLLRCSCLIEWEGDDRRAMAMGQYLASSYLLMGRSRRSQVAAEMCRRRLRPLGLGRSVELRLEWLEARALNIQGRFGEASSRLEAIREEFLSLDLPAFAAFVSLDLSISLIGLRRWGALVAVSEQMATFFVSRGISGEAAVAMALFREAVAAQTLTIAQVQALRERLALL